MPKRLGKVNAEGKMLRQVIEDFFPENTSLNVIATTGGLVKQGNFNHARKTIRSKLGLNRVEAQALFESIKPVVASFKPVLKTGS
jgi:hypothetical protein